MEEIKTGKIYTAISEIMKDISAVSKDKVNQMQHFNYRGIDDVMNALHPLFAKHKVFVAPEVLEQAREERDTTRGGKLIYSIMKIRYNFFTDDGSSVSATVIGEGMDSGDKASNKAMSIAFKYALFQIFCIPTEEMKDPDSETPEPSTPAKNYQQFQHAVEKPENFPQVKIITCEKCGDPIVPVPGLKGGLISAEDVARVSQARYHKNYCAECQKKIAAENEKEGK